MDTFTTGRAARYVGRTPKTLQRLDREGKLKPTRTTTGRRAYTQIQLDEFLGRKREKKVPVRVVVYCRVSSPAQKPDLKNQRLVLEEFCTARGFSGVDFVEEIGGGMNLTRPKFLSVLDAVGNDDVKTLVIAHKDRLCRFGFEWFARFCKQHGCDLLVLNQERLSPEQEMVQDLLAIVHTFSARLYGLRSYKKALKEALAKP